MDPYSRNVPQALRMYICTVLRVRKLVDFPPHLPNFVFAFRDNLFNALCCVHRNTKNLRFERLV